MSLQTAIAPPEVRPIAAEVVQKVVLQGVSWTTYKRLLAEHQESSGTHFAYDRGMLEIMVLSAEHEMYKHILALLVDILAEELEIEVVGYGSTTFRRKDLARGFEPDACFYIQHEAGMRGKKRIDLTVDPPPDLIIEIDITNPSLNKFPLFAALGIGEVWRYDGSRVAIFSLVEGGYREQAASSALSAVTSSALTEFVQTSQSLKRTVWLRRVREWGQTQKTT